MGSQLSSWPPGYESGSSPHLSVQPTFVERRPQLFGQVYDPGQAFGSGNSQVLTDEVVQFPQFLDSV